MKKQIDWTLVACIAGAAIVIFLLGQFTLRREWEEPIPTFQGEVRSTSHPRSIAASQRTAGMCQKRSFG
jgi:hypothetical protein